MSISSASRSPPLSPTVTHMFNMLDAAAEQLMVHQDFQEAFYTCESSLENLSCMEEDDTRCAELKAGFCTVGIQALAELNQWKGVFSWVLQLYGRQERIPAKIMQMCILLYFKVGEPAVMQEAARAWLHHPSNSRVAGFGTVAELYLLNVLLPLGQTDRARELIAGEVASVAFTEDQRQMALDVVEEFEQESKEAAPDPDGSSAGGISAVSEQGSVFHKLEATLRMFCRRLLAMGRGSFPLRRVFVAAVILYMLFTRLDPALPSSFLWISRLLQLIKQTWRTMFAPYYHAAAHRKDL